MVVLDEFFPVLWTNPKWYIFTKCDLMTFDDLKKVQGVV
jgi:hypothetical protein